MPSFPVQRSRDGLVFSDAIVLTDDEAAEASAGDIEAMGDARFEAWWQAVTAPPPEPDGE